jgi:hypothetical protein
VHLKQAVRVFLIWAIDAGYVPRREVPVLRFGRGPGLTQDERIDLIRRFVDDLTGMGNLPYPHLSRWADDGVHEPQ